MNEPTPVPKAIPTYLVNMSCVRLSQTHKQHRQGSTHWPVQVGGVESFVSIIALEESLSSL